MTLDRWWIPASELREMRYLGWYEGPDSKRRKAPWIIDSGKLDPDLLVESELFRGADVEAAIDFLRIPAGVSVRSGSILAYLQANGWHWSPDGTELEARPAWAARTATNVHFLLTRDGLLVDFGRFPRFDREVNCWAGSPLWAGFLIVCLCSAGIAPTGFPIDETELWEEPLKQLADEQRWLKERADATAAFLRSHFLALRRQRALKALALKRGHFGPKQKDDSKNDSNH